jgi:hypothetical protein
MLMEQLLTLFDEENPCWTEETLALAGEDAAALPALAGDGALELKDGVYSLSEAGRRI